MPAVSKAQQRLMAMAMHNPSRIRKANRGVLSMSQKDMEDFAKTKVKDLPEKRNSLKALYDGNAAMAKRIAKGGKK